MTLNGAIMQLVEMRENSMMPVCFKPYFDKVIETISECEEPSAQPAQLWIPCSERLPKESGRYLISALDGIQTRTTVAPYQPRCKAWTMTGRMTYWKVIAWMPLPEAYGGEQE